MFFGQLGRFTQEGRPFLQDILSCSVPSVRYSEGRQSEREVSPMSVARRELFLLRLASVFVSADLHSWAQAPPRVEPVVTHAIQIYLPAGGAWPVAVGADHAVFYIPVVGNGEML